MLGLQIIIPKLLQIISQLYFFFSTGEHFDDLRMAYLLLALSQFFLSPTNAEKFKAHLTQNNNKNYYLKQS